MEAFWENIVSTVILLLKVLGILIAIDLAGLLFGFDFRIPYVMMINDWILAKAVVLR